ncbi:MAG: M15 family metallopeptidase [Sphingomonadales bacterium]|jgi:D-alanyl-D-alanine carboxypeptidase
MLRPLLAALLLAGPGLAAPAGCTRPLAPAADGRLLNHLPYPEAPTALLVEAPAALGNAQCRINRAMLADMQALLAAAGSTPILAKSCFRSRPVQDNTFCGAIRVDPRYPTATARASVSAPPGFSEHATGLALDFRPRRKCAADWLDACYANTPEGQWLAANAPRFGFEMSFPPHNAQGVAHEPWHWRWVGRIATAPGAAEARALFATARSRFPASPALP